VCNSHFWPNKSILYPQLLIMCVRKTTESDYCLLYMCLSLRLLSVRIHGTARRPLNGFSWHLIFDYFLFFQNLSRKFKFYKNLISITATLRVREDLNTSFIVSWSILLRTKSIWDKRFCRGNLNTHFMFNNFFPQNRAFMIYFGAFCIDPDRPQRWQCNTAHAHCMLGN
jgi:hypothetical protein